MPLPFPSHPAALGLASFLGFFMHGPGAVVTAALRMDVVPPFDQPWLVRSQELLLLLPAAVATATQYS